MIGQQASPTELSLSKTLEDGKLENSEEDQRATLKTPKNTCVAQTMLLRLGHLLFLGLI